MIVSQNLIKISYLQKNDEFDYLKDLIKSLQKGMCMGILLHGPPGTKNQLYDKNWILTSSSNKTDLGDKLIKFCKLVVKDFFR